MPVLPTCLNNTYEGQATIQGVVFPAAKSGLFTGVILETGRAIGETMAILMVCGNVVQTPSSLFDPIRTLTTNIALEMAYALGDHRAALFVSGLVLMAMILTLTIAVEWISRGRIYG
jgi:phosphate transport system permease protein